MLKVGLYIMGLKGLNCLKAIYDFTQESDATSLSYVVYATDKNVANDYALEIEAFCKKHSLPLIARKDEDENLSNCSDINFAIGWRWIIPNENDNLIVLHDSILPKYRGFNPLVTALIEGDKEIGVTALKANAEYDRGNIVGVKTITIAYPITIETAIEEISKCYDDLVIDVLKNKAADTLKETVQDEAQASYSLWRDDEDYQIDWQQEGYRILNFINAVGFPYAGAVTYLDNQKIIIVKAAIAEDVLIANRTPGKVIFMDSGIPTVVCGKGLLRVIEAIDAETGKKIIFQKFRSRFK
ncbi:formyltransferase family protein [Flavobacterium enshiense]|uniref:methionyl-tRNA formyltransferase n=1 Tax=Flavobacterium enshiense TaxID=1341165 RepID=UPI00345CD8C5